MTGVRQSILFRIEDTFAEDLYPRTVGPNGNIIDDGRKDWIAVPPGSYFQNTHTRNTSKIYGTGSKFYEMASYGAINGSWEWTFPLTYEYLEPFLLVFEQYYTPAESNSNFHEFRKSNASRVKSFSIRRKILNRVAGGPEGSDELDYVIGCVVKSIRISRSAGSSQANVTLSGSYSKDRIINGNLESTDYITHNDGSLVEFGCLLYDNMPTLAQTQQEGFVKPETIPYVDSLTIALDNGLGMIPVTCSPFSAGYYEGKSSFQFGMTTYANDPNRVKKRAYSGGHMPTTGLPGAAMTRGMKPLPIATVFSFDSNADVITDGSAGSNLELVGAPKDPVYRFIDSDNAAMFTIEDTIVKSITWSKGDGGRLMDQMSSAECKNIVFRFKVKGVLDYTKTHRPFDTGEESE